MIRSLFIVPLVVVASLGVFAACGGDDDSPLSEEEYFDRLEGITILSDAREAAGEQAGDAPPDSEGYEAWAEWALNDQLFWIRAQADAYPDFIEELEAIEPPDTMRDVHALWLSAAKAASLGYAEVLADLERSESLDEIADAISGPILAALEQQFEACKALEDASDGGFSCLTEGICYSDAGRDEVVACSDEGTSGAGINIAPGIIGRLRDVPPLPDGYEALSLYIVFEVDGPKGTTTIGLPLERDVDDASDLGWYSYEDGEWRRLDVRVVLVSGGRVAEGDFDSVPASLIVLRER